MSDIEIVPYTAEHAAEVADLLNAGLARKLVGVRDVDYWNWKHEQNPCGRSLMLMARADGRVVGIRAFMRWNMRCGGEVIQAAKPVDSVTHPDYQRRGIFSRLTRQACELAAAEGVAFLFNTPNRNSKPGYLKLGWHVVGELALYAKIVRPFSAASHALRWKLAGGGLPPRDAYFSAEPQRASAVLLDQAVADLLKGRADGAAQLETLRTPEFLRWRYGDHPHLEYFAETVEDQGQLAGILVFRTNLRHGLREIMITDLIVRHNNTDAIVDRLLRQLKANTRGDYWIVCMDNCSKTSTALRAWRFWTVPKKRISLVARALRPDGLPVQQLDRWSLCFGDLEGL
ncbi:GNAT family N-acetyltransferase [Roseimaritima ulvae]|uniref:N-acetyltransferase domain-containing protein n=1 Tax=Roseimaritima ulvae TaxID=980254 RepID=A0A5B9QXH8_9BACT|nr:GNAT family N-acetyltransferase [Roseimaritima ulvae]QEG38671.1 hypothetical protein UC8_06290 [Roseimaritima ulvae]